MYECTLTFDNRLTELKHERPLELLQGFVVGLYTEAVAIVVGLVNRALQCAATSSQKALSAEKRKASDTAFMTPSESTSATIHTATTTYNVPLRAAYASAASAYTMFVLDAPGFQNAATCGRQTGASFEDLVYNYVNERLHSLFYHLTFTVCRDKYAQVSCGCGKCL